MRIAKQTIDGCHTLGVQVLLFPFFGPSNFQTDDAVLEGVAGFMQELHQTLQPNWKTIMPKLSQCSVARLCLLAFCIIQTRANVNARDSTKYSRKL